MVRARFFGGLLSGDYDLRTSCLLMPACSGRRKFGLHRSRIDPYPPLCEIDENLIRHNLSAVECCCDNRRLLCPDCITIRNYPLSDFISIARSACP